MAFLLVNAYHVLITCLSTPQERRSTMKRLSLFLFSSIALAITMSLAARAEQFGNIAHIFSTYESRHAKDDAQPFQRGINSIQLMNDGKRWWIVTIFWQGEDEKNPLPSKYLTGKN